MTGSLRERSGHRLLFHSGTWHSSIAILKYLSIPGLLLYPCPTSVTLCWAVWMAEHTASPCSSAPASAVQVVGMGAHYDSFCISWCFQHHNYLNPWGFAAFLNFAIFSSLLVCTHHLSLPLAAEAGGTAANEWSKDITNSSHQETLQRNLSVPFQ